MRHDHGLSGLSLFLVLCMGACVGGAATTPTPGTGGSSATGGAVGTGGLGVGVGSGGASATGSGGMTTSGGAPGGTGSGGSDLPGSGGAGGTLGSGGAGAVVGSGGAVATGGSGAGGRASTGGASGGTGSDGGVDGGLPTDGGGRDAGGDVNQSTLPNITLYLPGDSTVMTYAASSAQEGWGQELGQFFISKVTIDNQAIGGASVKTFMYSDAANTVRAAGWARIHSGIKAGDYLMVQFGANDSGSVAGRHVEPADFQALLGRMVDAVKAKQATPILVTPSALQEWSGGRQGNVRLGPYATAMRNLGPLKSVLVDDLNARSVEYLNMIGQTAAQQIYIGGDKAHFTKTGAIQMARFVAEELRRIGSPLASYLK